MSLEAALRAVLPADVAVACAPAGADHPPLFPAEAAAVAKARLARKQEFAAGRACARAALAALGGPQVAVPVAGDRQPLWPQRYVGAIAHKADWAAAVVGRAAAYAGLGVDLETPEPLPDGVAERICLPGELAGGRSIVMPDGQELDRGKLVFSAKETLFKSYYPATGYFLDFPEAQVRFDAGSGAFTAELVNDSAPALEGARRFKGRFGHASGLLFAVMAPPRG